MKTLTRRQKQILDVIQNHVSELGYAPSIRQISEAVGLSSFSTVHMHLQTLQRKGYISRNPGKARSIELLTGPNIGYTAKAEVYRRAMLAALANPHAWREILENALNPMPAEAAEVAA